MVVHADYMFSVPFMLYLPSERIKMSKLTYTVTILKLYSGTMAVLTTSKHISRERVYPEISANVIL